MAQLSFYYAAMNAGKTTMLLQTSYNYRERGMDTVLFLPEVVNNKKGKIISRIGLEAKAVSFDRHFNFKDYMVTSSVGDQQKYPECIMVDEAQFLTQEQVKQLAEIVDLYDISVEAYGLRTDFQGNLFEGSNHLLAWSDALIELKTLCHCGRKAIMNMRVDAKGNKLVLGPQVQIGGNEAYVATCRKHYGQGHSRPILTKGFQDTL